MEKMSYKTNTMRNWFLLERDYYDEKVLVIHGQFYNRPKFFDGTVGTSSIIKEIKINEAENEYEIQTQNTLYHCSFDSILFEQQDKSAYQLPDYERIKKLYYKPVDKNNLKPDDILLVVADYMDFFFEKLIYQNKDGTQGKYCGCPHIGTYTDTYLISSNSEAGGSDDEEIDIRYYIMNQAFEFYSLHTGNRSLWIENRGENVLSIYNNGSKIIELNSGERILYKE